MLKFTVNSGVERLFYKTNDYKTLESYNADINNFNLGNIKVISFVDVDGKLITICPGMCIIEAEEIYGGGD